MARRAVPRLWGAILGGLGSEQRRHAWGGWQVGRGARGQWCNGQYVPSPWDLSTKALCIYTAPPPPQCALLETEKRQVMMVMREGWLEGRGGLGACESGEGWVSR